MCESASPLPDDLALCHEIIRQQAETIRESRRRIEQLEHQRGLGNLGGLRSLSPLFL